MHTRHELMMMIGVVDGWYRISLPGAGIGNWKLEVRAEEERNSKWTRSREM